MLARELTVSADFAEGVRAVLIDKDTMPPLDIPFCELPRTPAHEGWPKHVH